MEILTTQDSGPTGAALGRLFDQQLAEVRQVAVDLIAEGSSVLDIGCETGPLSFASIPQQPTP